jgi:hypothetical protein
MVTHVFRLIGEVIGISVLVIIGAWVLAAVVMAAIAITLWVSQGSPDAVRNAFRRSVAGRDPQGTLHTGDQVSAPAEVAARVRDLTAADPDFDLTAFLDGTRLAVGAYTIASLAADDRLLRRITTPGFWATPIGKQIAVSVFRLQHYAAQMHHDAAGQGALILNVGWRQPVLTNVVLGEQGVDRITVRLASIGVGATDAAGWRLVDSVIERDWDFVRPSGQKTDPEAVMLSRTCAKCGGPFRSDIDDVCPYCHEPRADAQAGWRLDRNYLVVQTG